MKATGIIHKIDDLGRVIIPREIRRTIGIQAGDALEMYVDEEMGGIVLIPYFSTVPQKIMSIATSLNKTGTTEKEREIVNKLKKIAEELKSFEKPLDK